MSGGIMDERVRFGSNKMESTEFKVPAGTSLSDSQKENLINYYDWLKFEAWDHDTIVHLIDYMPETMLFMARKIIYAIQNDPTISETEKRFLDRFIF